MDEITNPLVEEVTFMSSSQVAKTELINNTVGYFVDQDPCPILVIQPILDLAETWSKDRLAPMVRDTPCLTAKVSDSKSKDSSNTILHKKFPGGHITIAGANSPASLASRPIRILLQDEVDRYPPSAGAEGDPGKISEARTRNFWNRKIVRTSTPVDKDTSRILESYRLSDQRHYHVPCPHCDHLQTLRWEHVIWDKRVDEDTGEEIHDASSARYVCESCAKNLTDLDLDKAVRKGVWRATAPFNGHAGFHINAFYSPWVKLAKLVQEFLDAKDFPDKLKPWVNTYLGEAWEEKGVTIDETSIRNRVEAYTAPVPEGGFLVTSGVDIQIDRAEIETVAWGLGEENWSIDYRVLWGNPGEQSFWDNLDEFLAGTEFLHETGYPLKIMAAGIDSGAHTDAVYKFCADKYNRRVYALKGIGGPNRPIVGRPTANNSYKCLLYGVGTDIAKDLLFARLKIRDSGPGFCHFPAHYPESYFRGLTSEQAITKYVKGVPYRAYAKRHKSIRNEPLDCRVYNIAALRIVKPKLEKIASYFAEQVRQFRNNPGRQGSVLPENQSRGRRVRHGGIHA